MRYPMLALACLLVCGGCAAEGVGLRDPDAMVIPAGYRQDCPGLLVAAARMTLNSRHEKFQLFQSGKPVTRVADLDPAMPAEIKMYDSWQLDHGSLFTWDSFAIVAQLDEGPRP